MGKDTKIEWAHHTFNPWWGCVEVSAACDHCYARTFATRLGFDIWGADKPRRFFGDTHWAEPLKWDRAAAKAGERHRVFCASMSDVCEHHPDPAVERQLNDARRRLAELIIRTPNLDWLLLTKRPERFTLAFPFHYFGVFGVGPYPPNLWGGTTVETEKFALHRVHRLIDLPLTVRFLSVEPMLDGFRVPLCRLCGCVTHHTCRGSDDDRPDIHWIIVGGESGHGARPMHPDWARAIRDRCVENGAAFLFKQWGDWAPVYDRDRDDPDWRAVPSPTPPGERWLNLAGGHGFHGDRVVLMRRVGKAAAGRELDGRTWDEVPQAGGDHALG